MSLPSPPLKEPSPLERPSERRTNPGQKAPVLVISGAVAVLSHIVFLLLLPPAWQRNQSTDYSAYYEPVARKLASGGGLFLGSKPAIVYPRGIPVMYALTFRLGMAASPMHSRNGFFSASCYICRWSFLGRENFGVPTVSRGIFFWSLC